MLSGSAVGKGLNATWEARSANRIQHEVSEIELVVHCSSEAQHGNYMYMLRARSSEVKGKSAKKGVLSGLVPFVQILGCMCHGVAG